MPESVKTFDVVVLVRLAWLELAQLQAALVGPRHHRHAAELLTVAGPHPLRQATGQHQSVQHRWHAVAPPITPP